jgi:site-specific DNA-cytosine methylase
MFDAIGAHIYAGGFTVGVSEHFNVLAHLEHSDYGAEVVRLNFPDMPIHAGGPGAWPDRWLPRPRFGFANPPCALWSSASAGRAVGWRDDPRLQMHHDIFDYFVRQDLDVFSMESVTKVFTDGREHVDDLVAKAADAGYSFTAVLHDARYLGVPQTRKRVFLTFHKVHVDWDVPDFDGVRTVAHALSEVKKFRDPYDVTLPRNLADLIKLAKPGEHPRLTFNRLNPDPELRPNGRVAGRPHFLMKRLHADKPSLVVTAGNLIHPTEPRMLYKEELAALCSFPAGYKWPKGNELTLSGYMSRGVMPKVGEWLAGNVARALETNRRINRPRAEVLDITGPPGRLYDLQPREETREMARSVQVAAQKGLPDRAEGEGSGAYIRRLLGMGAVDDAILERVHAQFPGSKATKSDVAYNRAKLRKDGAPPPPPERTAPMVVEAQMPKKYAALAKAAERGHPLPPLDGVSSAQAVSALRVVVNRKATVPGLAALLNLSLDLMEKL